MFDLLPVAAVVNGQYLCMHGGISDELKSLNGINSIDRKREPPEHECLLSDLLWADPQSNRTTDIDYEYNDKRKISVVFGKRPVNSLLQKEGLKAIVRAHECKQRGYKFHQWNGAEEFPPVITIFSAPNYCGTHDNQAAVLISKGEDVDIRTFTERKTVPYTLPDDEPLSDAFTFFHDGLCGHVLDFLYQVLQTAHVKCKGRRRMAHALSASASYDSAYIETLMKTSLDKEKKARGSPRSPKSPRTPVLEEIKEVPAETQGAQVENEEEESKAKTIDDLLGDFEKEMDIEDLGAGEAILAG